MAAACIALKQRSSLRRLNLRIGKNNSLAIYFLCNSRRLGFNMSFGTSRENGTDASPNPCRKHYDRVNPNSKTLISSLFSATVPTKGYRPRTSFFVNRTTPWIRRIKAKRTAYTFKTTTGLDSLEPKPAGEF